MIYDLRIHCIALLNLTFRPKRLFRFFIIIQYSEKRIKLSFKVILKGCFSILIGPKIIEILVYFIKITCYTNTRTSVIHIIFEFKCLLFPHKITIALIYMILIVNELIKDFFDLLKLFDNNIL
jgi:hypothetical protein